MKTDLNLTGWNRLTISQKAERDLKVYKKAVNFIEKNWDVMGSIVALICFISAILLLKLMMVPYPVPA